MFIKVSKFIVGRPIKHRLDYCLIASSGINWEVTTLISRKSVRGLGLLIIIDAFLMLDRTFVHQTSVQGSALVNTVISLPNLLQRIISTNAKQSTVQKHTFSLEILLCFG